jgi:endoglucanase
MKIMKNKKITYSLKPLAGCIAAIICAVSFAIPAQAEVGNPRVNQIGYLPNGPKLAVYKTASVSAQPWQLMRNGSVIASGQTSPKGFDAASGDNLHQIDLSTEVWPKGAQARNSIITTSQLHRALITAMTFFIGNRFTAYAPSDWQKGFGNVAPRPLWGRLLRTFEQDLRELGSLDECLSAGLDPGAWAASLDGT